MSKNAKTVSKRAERVRKAKGLTEGETPAVNPTQITPTIENETTATEKKHVLSAEAHAHRKMLVKTNPKLRGICSAFNVEKAFEGRGENPVSLDEFKAWVDAQVAEKDNAPKVFTPDAYRKVIARNKDLMREIFTLFDGRQDVGVEEVLLKVAEIRVGRNVDIDLKTDGDPMICAVCEFPFVPMTRTEYIGPKDDMKPITVGSFRVVEGAMHPVCHGCEPVVKRVAWDKFQEALKTWAAGGEQGEKPIFKAPRFYPLAYATEKAARQQEGIAKRMDREQARQERFEQKRTKASFLLGDSVSQNRGGNRGTRGPARQVSDEVLRRYSRNSFHALLEDGEIGDFAGMLTWKNRDGKEVETSIHVRSQKVSGGEVQLTIVSAGPELSNQANRSYMLHSLPAFLFAVLKKAAERQSESA